MCVCTQVAATAEATVFFNDYSTCVTYSSDSITSCALFLLDCNVFLSLGLLLSRPDLGLCRSAERVTLEIDSRTDLFPVLLCLSSGLRYTEVVLK